MCVHSQSRRYFATVLLPTAVGVAALVFTYKIRRINPHFRDTRAAHFMLLFSLIAALLTCAAHYTPYLDINQTYGYVHEYTYNYDRLKCFQEEIMNIFLSTARFSNEKHSLLIISITVSRICLFFLHCDSGYFWFRVCCSHTRSECRRCSWARKYMASVSSAKSLGGELCSGPPDLTT